MKEVKLGITKLWNKVLSIWLALCLSHSAALHAQQFIEVSEELGVEFATNGLFGSGICVYDFDKDGLDDLSMTSYGGAISFYRNTGGPFEVLQFEGIPSGNINFTHLLWVDYDNDGDPDLSLCSRLHGYWLLQNDGNFNFTDVAPQLQLAPYDRLYGHSWGDYDRDGDLDVYFTVYSTVPNSSTNQLYRNDESLFVNVTLEQGVGNGLSPSYQSTWADVNHDRWPELLLVNDREDFFNQLYLNSLGTLSEYGVESGFYVDMCSMSNTVGDYDNDGDLDVFVTNKPLNGNYLFQNNGDLTFTEVGETAGVRTHSFCWSANWLDVNNDGWRDLYISSQYIAEGFLNRLYIQTSPGNFVESENSGLQDNVGATYNSATGDLDLDGNIDLVTMSYEPYGTEVWLNQNPTGHSVRIRPEGVVSNKDGIGTWIQLFADNHYSCHYTSCGEAFMGQSSNWIHFGLDTLATIDSLILEWPGGHTDTFYDLPVNQSFHLIEGASIQSGLTPSADTLVCEQDASLTLTAANGFSSYLWNTGETGQSVQVSQSGAYWVTVTNQWGLSATDTIQVDFGAQPVIEVLVENESCPGFNDGSILLNSNADIAVWWGIDSVGQSLSGLAPGEYTYEAVASDGCSVEGTISIEAATELALNAESTEPSCYGSSDGSITLTPENADIAELYWNGTPGSTELFGIPAGNYLCEGISSNGCPFSEMIQLEQPAQIDVLAVIEQPACATDSASVELIFEIEVPLDEIVWNTGATGNYLSGLEPGEYTWTLTDLNACSVSGNISITAPTAMTVNTAFSQDANCPDAWQGSLSLSGGTPPFEILWNFWCGDLSLPSISQSTSWTCTGENCDLTAEWIITDANGCLLSGLSELGFANSIHEAATTQIKVFPNPAKDQLFIDIPGPSNFKMFRSDGSLCMHGPLRAGLNGIDLTSLSPGPYLIWMLIGNNSHSVPVIIE